MDDPFFANNPVYMKSLIGKTVSVETVDNKTREGAVYVIDPITKTLVLTDPASRSLEVIFYHGIKTITVLENAPIETPSVLEETQIGDLKAIKSKLLKWLKHMFYDVIEDGEYLRVDKHLSIGPPYTKEGVLCDNTIVLDRINNIIDLMPPNFQ